MSKGLQVLTRKILRKKPELGAAISSQKRQVGSSLDTSATSVPANPHTSVLGGFADGRANLGLTSFGSSAR